MKPPDTGLGGMCAAAVPPTQVSSLRRHLIGRSDLRPVRTLFA